MMVNVRVAYINLRSRPDRGDAFLRNNRTELDASAFPWRRVDGIDGSQLASSTLVAQDHCPRRTAGRLSASYLGASGVCVIPPVTLGGGGSVSRR